MHCNLRPPNAKPVVILFNYDARAKFEVAQPISCCLTLIAFSPRCMECQRGLATRKVSVCPSVKCVHCDKTEERSVKIFIPYERSFSLVF